MNGFTCFLIGEWRPFILILNTIAFCPFEFRSLFVTVERDKLN